MRLLNPITTCSSRAQQRLASDGSGSSAAMSSCWNGLCFGCTLCRMQREERGRSNWWLNLQSIGVWSEGKNSKAHPSWEGIRTGGHCACWRRLCWWERVACETSLFLPWKAPGELRNDISCIRMFLMITLICLIAYKTATNQRLWYGRSHKSLWYAQVKGMVICVYLYILKSSHTCTLCMFLKSFGVYALLEYK